MKDFRVLDKAISEKLFLEIEFKDGQIAPHELPLGVDGGGEVFFVKPSQELLRQCVGVDQVEKLGIEYDDVKSIKIT